MLEICEKEMRHESGFYRKRPVALVRGEGARVWDAEGREYIDCIGGHGVAVVGHANPAVAEAIAVQARKLLTCPNGYCNDVRAELLELLVSIAPGDFGRAFLCNSGAEAVEAALKIARIVTGKTGFVAAMRGFHGRTLGALSCTWRREYREPVEPLVPGVTFVPYNDLEAMARALEGGDVAGVILEVVQGESGVIPGKGEYLRGVEALCREHNALFIVDEVQTGFGRTGRMFACEHYGLEPDLLCVAKGIAGGVPMGAVLIHRRLGRMPARLHGSTFGGNPLACAAALAAIRYIREEELPRRAAELGAYFLERLRGLSSPLVREVRGLGLMVGIELKRTVRPFIDALVDKGVLTLPAGTTVIRFLPPLVISREELDRVAEAVGEVLHG